MLRTQLSEALKDAMRSKDQRATGTIRLILAALKDRDIAARTESDSGGISDDEILQMLQKMVRQSREAAETYEGAGRDDLAKKERQEIAVIERFLPKPLSEEETVAAVEKAITDVGAESMKDMGKVMALLKDRYAGRMDFAKASGLTKQRLA